MTSARFRGRSFIVMGFVEGQTLRARIDAGAVPLKDAVSIAMQIASALAAAHTRAIVHRDIKPENVMLWSDGYVKVLDFGLARQVAGHSTETRTDAQPEALVGTLRYMSPEQSRGESALAPSDLVKRVRDPLWRALQYDVGTDARRSARDALFRSLLDNPPFPAGRSLDEQRDHVRQLSPSLDERGVPNVYLLKKQ